jgi:hypothetical protein
MARAKCLNAVLRVMPSVVEMDTDLKHCEVLRDPGFLRERLSSLPPKKLEELSSAYIYALSIQLWDWYRELKRHWHNDEFVRATRFLYVYERVPGHGARD